MFYEPSPDPRLLWQGDIIRNFIVPGPLETVLIVRDPPPPIPSTTLLNGRSLPIRAIFSREDLVDAYALNKETLVVDSSLTIVAIVSQSCDIDRKPFLTLAVVSPITLVTNLSRKEELKRWDRVFENFWLPPENGIEESFVDLTLLFSVPRDALIGKIGDRILSMTADYRNKFKYKLAQYFSRPDE